MCGLNIIIGTLPFMDVTQNNTRAGGALDGRHIR
jgi:hypothetical protein